MSTAVSAHHRHGVRGADEGGLSPRATITPQAIRAAQSGTVESEGGADGSLPVISRPASGCPAVPYVFACEADSKNDSHSASRSGRRGPREVAPSVWHPHEKTRPQNDVRRPAACCDLVRKEPELPE